MTLPAANAIQQTGALKALIKSRSTDGVVNLKDVRDIIALARRENVQVGELGELRKLGGSSSLTPRARDFFVPRVDATFPAGAPTAQMAAIIFRLDPAAGRKQLLSLLDHAQNPVPGGPKTYVVRGLGPPYLAAITTGQVVTALTKFLDGASPADATKIRRYLHAQLRTLDTPVSRGGLAAPGIVHAPRGLALSDDTREGGIIAVNQSAVVLRSLEKVALLKGPGNAALAADARDVARRVARELKAELDFTYPASGRIAYSLTMRNGKPATVRLEDGDHLKTTMTALKSMQIFSHFFGGVVKRMEARLPELSIAAPEDLNGTAGRIYTDAYNSFRASAAAAMADGKVTASELQRLDTLSRQDGLQTAGERGLIARARRIPG